MLGLWEYTMSRDPHIYLREWRDTMALTQKELAERTALQEVTISRIELGKARAQAGTRRKLAEALGINTADLLGPPPAFEVMATG
jgi:transcriptional regulator with XRE-family HTH domain